MHTVPLINKLKFSRILSSAHTRSNVQQCKSTRVSMYEHTRSIVQAHASLQLLYRRYMRGVHRYASNRTSVSRALPACQARERHTHKSGLVRHTREWQVLLFTHTCVAYRYCNYGYSTNTASKSFCCFIQRCCFSLCGINPMQVFTRINTWFNLPLETIPFFPPRQLHIRVLLYM